MVGDADGDVLAVGKFLQVFFEDVMIGVVAAAVAEDEDFGGLGKGGAAFANPPEFEAVVSGGLAPFRSQKWTFVGNVNFDNGEQETTVPGSHNGP